MVSSSLPIKVSMAVLLATLLLIARPCSGQITITSQRFNVDLISPSTLFHTILYNTGQNTRFWIEGMILDSRSETVLSFVTQAQEIKSGTWSYTAQDLVMKSFLYGSIEAGRSAQLFQRLPGGSYRTCLTVKSSTEGSDRSCEVHEVDDFLSLDLVHPWNMDTVEETRPTLTWAISSGGTPVINTRLVLTPLPDGRKPAHALASERPLFMVPEVKPGPVQYPIAIADLERGKCYAWQVEQVDGPRVKERSEPWGFCVRQVPTPPANKYVRMDRLEAGTIYDAFDEHIYFRYDESYSSRSMKCAIYGPSRNRIEPTTMAENGEVATPNARVIGANLFDLDLQPYNLKKGTYELVVTDEVGRTTSLTFKIDR